MSAQRLSRPAAPPRVVTGRIDPTTRGALHTRFRRVAFDLGVEPVRLHAMFSAMEDAEATLRGDKPLPAVILQLRDRFEAICPDSAAITRPLLEQATGILLVAALRRGINAGALVLDAALGQPGEPLASPPTDCPPAQAPSPTVPDHVRELRAGIESDAGLQALFATRAVGVCLSSPDGYIVKANDRLRTILGIEETDLMGWRREDIVRSQFTLSPGQLDAFLHHQSLDAPEYTVESLLTRADGSTAWVVADSVLVPGPDGQPRYFLSLLEDVTFERIAARAPQPDGDRVLTLLQNASDIFGIVSSTGRLEYISRSVKRVLGHEPEMLHNTGLLDLAEPEERAKLVAGMRAALERPSGTERVNAHLRHVDGSDRYLEIDFTQLDDAEGVTGLVFSARDVSARKSAEERLQQLAYFDSLTSLPNRVQFLQQLDDALGTAASTGGRVGVIFIDLDRFKAINDRFGHDRGDSTLVAVGQLLTTALQEGQLGARYGGDEFAVLLRDTSPSRAMRVARRVIRAVSNAYPEEAHRDGPGVSAGVALWAEGMESAQDLLRAADLALYRSKARGGGVATLHRPQLAAWELQSDVRRDLQRGLDHHEFLPWYAPDVDLVQGRVVGIGVEARWHRPGALPVPLDGFQEAIDDLGIGVDVDCQVLTAAVADAAGWAADHILPPEVVLGVPVSTAAIACDRFETCLRDAMAALPAPSMRLVIELDSLTMADVADELPRFVAMVRACGAEVRVRRFRGGYVVWRFISALKIPSLRLERMEPLPGTTPEADAPLFEAYGAIATKLGVTGIAMGVASSEDVAYGLRFGCRTGQGPHFSPPLPAADVPGLLQRPLLP